MRKPRGFVLLLVLGIVVGLTAAIMFMLLSIERHARLEGMDRRQKMAHYAAEAGLAEAREIFRLAVEHEAAGGNSRLADILGHFAVVKDFEDLRPWYDLFCRGTQECNQWAPFRFEEGKTVEMAGVDSAFGPLDSADLWAGRVRYRAFAYVYADELLSAKITDSPPIVLVGLGEAGDEGQTPYRMYTRATVAYRTDAKPPTSAGGGSTFKGGEGNAFVER